MKDSPWISTTKDANIAQSKYGKNGATIVKIDTDKLPVGTIIEDISNGIQSASNKINNFVKADKEVLIKGIIPPDAITTIR
jgi:hypothetical protein